MKLNITLCKTPINTTDTLYFANVEAQKAYFNSITDKIEYTNASFNGARNFRIQENYLAAINSKYNYMYYEYDGRVWYTFIDKYKYVNDNVTELEVTLDFLQTFMFDITLKTSRVASYTWKEAHFEQDYKVPYSNKFPAANFKWEVLKDLAYYNAPNRLINLCITVNRDLFNDEGYKNVTKIHIGNIDYKIDHSFKALNYPADLPFITLIFPLTVTHPSGGAFPSGMVYCNVEDDSYSNSIEKISNLIEMINPYILDISIVTNKLYDVKTFNGVTVTTNNVYAKTAIVTGEIDAYYYLLNFDKIDRPFFGNEWAYGIYSETFEIDMSEYKDSLVNSAYMSLMISNGVDESFIELDDYLYESDVGGINKGKIMLRYNASQVYPYTYTITIYAYSHFNNKTFKISRSDAISMPYAVDKWMEYVASNSASVNDGLRTKHGYEREIAKANLANKTAQGSVQTLAGIGTIAGAATSAIFNPAQAVNMGMNGLNQAIQGAGSIADAVVQYENTLTNQEKERALLKISWQDIKNTPADVMSFGAVHGLQGVNEFISSVIYIGIASNIEAIKKYHKMYGYETHEVISPADLKRAHNIFDYIRFEDANFITNLAHNTHNIIKSILESGVRFWYDIDTFMNFDIENTEYEG